VIPTTPQWRALAFSTGLNVGTTGYDWFTFAQEGAEWGANPGAGYGVAYGLGLGPAGPDTEIFVSLAGPGQQSVYLLGSALSSLQDGWTSHWDVEPPAADATDPIVWFGASRADHVGGILSVAYNFGAAEWRVEVWDGLGWVILYTSPVLPADVHVRLVRENGGSTVRFYLDGAYLGETPELDLSVAGPAAWMALGSPVNGVLLTVGGANGMRLTSWLVGPTGIRPVANAGPDQVSVLGRVAGFDGTDSFDPDVTGLDYQWRLVRAPAGSEFLYEGTGTVGATELTLHSVGIGAAAPGGAVAVGDVVVLEGAEYDVMDSAADDVVLDRPLPAGFAGPFIAVRQAAVVGADSRYFAFVPDLVGLYVSRLLVVDDDGLMSEPDLAAVNILGSSVPMRVPLDMGFLWDYLSDFWRSVANTDWIAHAWMAMARIVAAHLQDIWNIDFDKSLYTTQNVVMRRWLDYHPRLDASASDAPVFHARRAPAIGQVRYTKADLDNVGLVLVLPDVFTLTVETEAGSMVVTATAPSGTLLRDVPSHLNADLEAQGLDYLRFNLQETDPEVPGVFDARFRMVCRSESYSFSVVDDATFYLVAAENGFQGATADVLTNRVVRLTDFVLDLDDTIQVGDILNLGSRSFAVKAKGRVRDALTYFAYDTLEVGMDIPDALVGNSVWWCIPPFWESQITDWHLEGCTPGDLLYLARTSVADPMTTDEVQVDVYGAGTRRVGAMHSSLYWPAYAYAPSYVRRYFYLKVEPEVLGVPQLQEEPDTPSWVMQEYLHFVVDERRDGRYLVLDFRDEPADEMQAAALVRSRANLTFLPDYLWAEVSHIDNRSTVEANFGRMVNAFVADFSYADANYLTIVTGLWLVYSRGPTPGTIERACAVMLGYPYAEARGTVLDVAEGFLPGRTYMLVRDLDRSSVIRSYVYPTGDGLAVNPATGAAYAIGDTVEQFAILVQTQIYYDHVDDPEWWTGMRGLGLFAEPEKLHRFGVVLDSRHVHMEVVSQVIDFVLDFKKSHTYPLFQLLSKLEDTIRITDEVSLMVTLELRDGLWENPTPPYFDCPRLGSGIRMSTSYGRDDDVLFRMTAQPGTAVALSWAEMVGDPPYRIQARASNVLGVALDPITNIITISFDRGSTTAANVVAAFNADPTVSPIVTAYLPAGSAGAGTIDAEYGPVRVNHYGEFQARFDESSPPSSAFEGVSALQQPGTPLTTLLDAIGGNVAAGVVTVGRHHRVSLAQPGPVWFHDGLTPAGTELAPVRDWLVFYAPGPPPVYRCTAQIIGVGVNPLGAPFGFTEGGGFNILDVVTDGLEPAPLASNLFLVYQGNPNAARMSWLTTFAPDTYLSHVVDTNRIDAVVSVGGADYQLQVDAAHWFSSGGPPWLSALLVGDDYFTYYDANGSLQGIGRLASVDGLLLATVTVQPAPPLGVAPVLGGSFVVARRPRHTSMTPDYAGFESAYGVGFDLPLPADDVTVA